MDTESAKELNNRYMQPPMLVEACSTAAFDCKDAGFLSRLLYSSYMSLELLRNRNGGCVLSTFPTSLTISQGGSNTVMIIVTSMQGFSSTITFTIYGAPSDVAPSFNPASVTLPRDGTANSLSPCIAELISKHP